MVGSGMGMGARGRKEGLVMSLLFKSWLGFHFSPCL